MNIFKSVLFSSILNFYALFASAQAPAHLKHHHPLPLALCNIKAGSSTDAMVMALYGEGLFEINTRYYTDEGKKIILKVTIGNDQVIEQVAVCSYKLPFDEIKNKLQSIPAAKKLNVQAIMMGNIHIGDKREKIVLQFGDPNKTEKVNNINRLTYEDSSEEWKEILNYKATYEFIDDRLERIIILNAKSQ